MDRESKRVVDAFLAGQREMYAGGPLEPVSSLMAEEIVWHVPGTSPIAGEYRGREAVLDYFRTRRALAGGHIEITKHAELALDDVVVQLADGRARPGPDAVEWRTVGVYRVAAHKVAEGWLVPLEAAAFDRAWSELRSRAVSVGPSDTGEHELSSGAPEHMARCYRALGNPVRLRVLDLLQAGAEEVGVEELSMRLKIPRPTLSKHLKVLGDVGLVERRRAGRNLLFRVRWAPARAMLDAVADQLATYGVSVAQAIESEALQGS